jgi:predicted transcriptional regulator
MQILWKLKAFVEVMAEITEDQTYNNTLSTIVRNLKRKGYVAHNALTHINTIPQLVEDYRKRFMITAIDTSLIVRIKICVFFFKEDKISAAELRNLV